ncbi:MAG: cytochrome o ubiquinol oxidase subunit IV [Bacilli bacterium]
MLNTPESSRGIAPHHAERFPWKGIIGYVLSLILTGFSMWIGLTHAAQFGAAIFIILGLAVLQIFVQMFLFMHVTESDEGPPWQVLGLLAGLLFVATIVGMSMWIMTFNGQAA